MPDRALSLPQRSRVHAWGWALVLLAHGLGWLLLDWALPPAPTPRPAADQAPLLIRLLPGILFTPPVAPDVARRADATQRRNLPLPQTSVPTSPPRQPSAPGEPAAISLPAPSLPDTPARAVSSAASAPPASAPLDLRLPRQADAAWRRVNPALEASRARGRAPALETAIANALAAAEGPIREEPLADGSVRFRRGSACVRAYPNRAQGIDPFNASAQTAPRQIEPC